MAVIMVVARRRLSLSERDFDSESTECAEDVVLVYEVSILRRANDGKR